MSTEFSNGSTEIRDFLDICHQRCPIACKKGHLWWFSFWKRPERGSEKGRVMLRMSHLISGPEGKSYIGACSFYTDLDESGMDEMDMVCRNREFTDDEYLDAVRRMVLPHVVCMDDFNWCPCYPDIMMAIWNGNDGGMAKGDLQDGRQNRE